MLTYSATNRMLTIYMYHHILETKLPGTLLGPSSMPWTVTWNMTFQLGERLPALAVINIFTKYSSSDKEKLINFH